MANGNSRLVTFSGIENHSDVLEEYKLDFNRRPEFPLAMYPHTYPMNPRIGDPHNMEYHVKFEKKVNKLFLHFYYRKNKDTDLLRSSLIFYANEKAICPRNIRNINWHRDSSTIEIDLVLGVKEYQIKYDPGRNQFAFSFRTPDKNPRPGTYLFLCNIKFVDFQHINLDHCSDCYQPFGRGITCTTPYWRAPDIKIYLERTFPERDQWELFQYFDIGCPKDKE